MKKILIAISLFLSGNVFAATFGPDIHSQPTLQSGTTAYPSFLYVGSSASISIFGASTATINSLNVSTAGATFAPSNFKANAIGDSIGLIAKDGAANATITVMNASGTTSTRIEGGNNSTYGDYFEIVHLNTPSNNANYKGIFSSSATGVVILGTNYPTALQPSTYFGSYSLNVKSNSSGQAIRTISYDNSNSSSSWVFANTTGTALGDLQGGYDPSSGTFITAEVFNSTKVILIYGSTRTGVTLLGSPGGNDAAVGNYGEFFSSTTNGNTNFLGSTVAGDLASVTVTAGDWRLSSIMYTDVNGASVNSIQYGISTTAGNSLSGINFYENRTALAGVISTATVSQSIPNYRVKPTSTTTYYLKYYGDYGTATPRAQGGLFADRRR